MPDRDLPQVPEKTVRLRPGSGPPEGAQAPLPTGDSSELTDSNVDALAQEMAAAWEKGNRLSVEDFLRRFPELTQNPPAAARLIYEEFCLREEHGDPQTVAAVTARFPQWQNELEVLLGFHDLFEASAPPPPIYPVAGDQLGDFQLVTPLGHGAQGQVFLATQHSLGDRPLVLKLTPRSGEEHLALARLQHTHIVPLFAVYDFAERRLRALCMPFLGVVTLDDIVDALRATPPEKRHGHDVVRVLTDAEKKTPGLLPPHRVEANLLDSLTYVKAVCWIGAALAEALDYAHARGLVHLDLKPSNVLLNPDGLPLILDFHLARTPLQKGGDTPEWLGGTFGYLSPEQKSAMDAVQAGQPAPEVVDGRSDLYSLGLILVDLLGATRSMDDDEPPPLAELPRANPHVTPGLADILAKCLAPLPARRYARGAELAEDLRRYREDLPLKGVRNRSWCEQWHKWRRRRPMALPLAFLFLALTLALVGGGISLFAYQHERKLAAETALHDAQDKIRDGRFAEALPILVRAQHSLADLWGEHALENAIVRHVRLAERGHKATQLRSLASYLRFHTEAEGFSPRGFYFLEAACAKLWQQRSVLLEKGASDLGVALEANLRTDLLDLAILWGRLRVRLAKDKTAARRAAGDVLAEMIKCHGPLRGLLDEQHAHELAAGDQAKATILQHALAAQPGASAWEQYALGRSALGKDLDLARKHLLDALELAPKEFWPRLDLGICYFRQQKMAQALSNFSHCLGQEPRAEAYCWRARAYAALGDVEMAWRDANAAVRADPDLANTYLERGQLHTRKQDWTLAKRDLDTALEKGADPARVHYYLALLWLAQGQPAEALASVMEAVRLDAEFSPARELRDKLVGEKKKSR